MAYTTAADAIRPGARPSWKLAIYHFAAAIGLICADCVAFLTSYFLFRYSVPMPAAALFFGGQAHAGSHAVDTFLIAAATFILIRLVLGDYNRRQLFWEGTRATTATMVLLAVMDTAFGFLITGPWLFTIVVSWLFVIFALPVFRQGARHLMTALGVWRIPAALLGIRDTGVDADTALRDSLALGFDIRYLIVVDNGNEPVAEPPPEVAHLKRIVAKEPTALAAKLRETECGQVIIATGQAPWQGITEMTQRLLGAGVGVIIVPALRGLPLFGLRTNYFFGRNTLLLQVRNNLTRFPTQIVKRVTDVVCSLLLLTLLLPVFAVAAIAIKLEGGGPVFFVQPRVGRDAHQFPCFKFRTMIVDAEERLERWRYEQSELYDEYVRSNFKLREDPRVTRAGTILRRFSIDELPQLLNVLLGDMSLVGPRPLLAREIQEYGAGFDLYCRVRPGITGLWQTRGRSETQFSDRVSYDEWYILNWSYWYDLVIILQTAWIVVAGKGAY